MSVLKRIVGEDEAELFADARRGRPDVDLTDWAAVSYPAASGGCCCTR